MARKRTFKSIEEVVKAYWPKELQESEAALPVDPKVAGEELGRRVVKTFGRDLAARLSRNKS